MRHFLKHLFRNERGSAMTEFVIGLPVFVLIFSGMGSLYRIHEDILETKATRSAELWALADTGAGEIIPILAAGSAAGSWSDLAANGGSAFGIYADSGIKTSIPLIIPGTTPSSPCYTVNCALGGGGVGPDSHSYVLLNDNTAQAIFNSGTTFNADGWANVLASGLTVTGSRPSFAAGIRYGEEFVENGAESVTTTWGTYSYDVGKLDIPGVTQPTHRSIAVALTRVQMATEDFWNDQLPEFDNSFNFGTANASGSPQCDSALNNLNGCMTDPNAPAGETQSQAESRCEDQARGAADDCSDIAGNSAIGDLDLSWCTPGTPGCSGAQAN